GAAAPERRHADSRGSAARVAVLIVGDSSRGRIRERPNLISGIPRIEVIQCKKSVTVLHLGLRSGAEGLASRVGGVVRVTAQPAESVFHSSCSTSFIVCVSTSPEDLRRGGSRP